LQPSAVASFDTLWEGGTIEYRPAQTEKAELHDLAWKLYKGCQYKRALELIERLVAENDVPIMELLANWLLLGTPALELNIVRCEKLREMIDQIKSS